MGKIFLMHMRKNWPLLVLLFLSLAIHFLFLNYPAEAVFDEVHFGKFVNAYFTHQYYFDIHPPLGKLVIAGFAKIFNYSPASDFANIGEKISGQSLFILRFMPALFGAFLVLAVYWLILALGLSKKTAFLGACLVLLDNAYLVQARFILVDIFLVFFGVMALWFFVVSRKQIIFKRSIIYFTFAVFFAALACSVKWTGLSFLGIIGLFAIIDGIKKLKLKKLFLQLVILVAVFLAVYSLVFAINFKLLYISGPGDAFMSRAFQQTLLNNKTGEVSSPLPFWKKFIELNEKMYEYNKNITAKHPYGSKWFQWPIGSKPIWYWNGNQAGKSGSVYLLGNPIVWWLALLGILFSIFCLSKKTLRRKLGPAIYILLCGYFANLIPYIVVSRVTFLYHYLPSLLFGVLTFVLMYDRFSAALFKKKEKYFYWGILILVFLFFIYLAPLSYGFSLPKNIFQLYHKFPLN